MTEVLILTRPGAALRVAVLRRPSLRLRGMALRLLGEGWPPLRVARRLGLRRTYVNRLHHGDAPAPVQAARASWAALVVRETRALERAGHLCGVCKEGAAA